MIWVFFHFSFLTAILHCGLRNDFFLSQFTFSNFYLGFYFPFLFGLLFYLFSLDFYFPFLFGLLFPFYFPVPFSLFTLDFCSIAVKFWISSNIFVEIEIYLDKIYLPSSMPMQKVSLKLQNSIIAPSRFGNHC